MLVVAQVRELSAQPTEVAAHLTGSRPTDEDEAAAIMAGNGPESERNMARYNTLDVSHSDAGTIADKLIDDVEASNTDVTGKVGAVTYKDLLDKLSAKDPTDIRGASLRGSMPNYNAEAKYIISGVKGNYEKQVHLICVLCVFERGREKGGREALTVPVSKREKACQSPSHQIY